MSSMRVRFFDQVRLVRLAARLLAGRFYWLMAFVPLPWSIFHGLMLAFGGHEQAFEPVSAQNFLIGAPLTVLAVFLGVRIIAGEVDARRLEIAYTVPGGSRRVWVAKLLAAFGILVLAEILLATVTFVIFTSFPPSALYGAMQTAVFYLVVAMGMGALFKSEVTGTMVTAVVMLINLAPPLLVSRFSPMWNPLSLPESTEAVQILGWMIQNRIGFLLVLVALITLAFGRAERRETMLAG